MKFTIQFHTPFRVASGRSGDGADSTVDRANPLPASSLKGVMRSAARDLLGVAPHWVDLVYGEAWQPSPWAWSDATPTANGGSLGERPGDVRVRARIQISPDTNTVIAGALAMSEEVLAHRAQFTVTRAAWIEPDLVAAHHNVLLASARAVTAVGGDRRRGLGWVSITPADPPWPTDEQLPAYISRIVEALATLPNSGTAR